LASGSGLGIYFVCEINRASAMRKMGYEVMSHFEHRIAYFMNEDDSNEMINNGKANKLIDADNFNCRSKAIYYSQSSQVAVKFKSYINLQSADNLINPNFILDDSISISQWEHQTSNLDDVSVNLKKEYLDTVNIPDDLTIPLSEFFSEDNE
jgi:hypothetical protein